MPLDFLILWGKFTDDSLAQLSVTFYFNGVQIGEFAEQHEVVLTFWTDKGAFLR